MYFKLVLYLYRCVPRPRYPWHNSRLVTAAELIMVWKLSLHDWHTAWSGFVSWDKKNPSTTKIGAKKSSSPARSLTWTLSVVFGEAERKLQVKMVFLWQLKSAVAQPHPSLGLPPPSHREFWLCWVLSLLETRAQSGRSVTVINCSSTFLSPCPVTVLIKQDKEQEMGAVGHQGERWFVGFW